MGPLSGFDESAYYEYMCRRAGLQVHYCAEQFENDGSPTSTIIKSVKRAMAGEYSRELSSKVFKGQCKLIELGYRQGGPAGYRLRRMLIDQNGQPKGLLSQGEHKSLQTDRVVLVPGPDEEVRIVRHIYQQFTADHRSESHIAADLNTRGLLTDRNRPWTRAAVRQVLTNEKYLGHNVYNRVSFKLKKARVKNPPEMWVRADGAFEAIVDAASFYTARGIMQERNRRFTDEQMIQKLQTLLGEHAALSAHLIDQTDGVPSSATYRTRFGSLVEAYRRAGFEPDHDWSYIELNRRLRQLHPDLIDDAVQRLHAVGAAVQNGAEHLTVNQEYTAAIVVSRCRQTQAGTLHWQIRFAGRQVPDVTLMVRMDPCNEQPMDFYLLPLMEAQLPLRLRECNAAYVDAYRVESLEDFAQLALRKRIEARR